MPRIAPYAVAAIMFAATASSAPAQSVSTDPAKAQAGAYAVEPMHTRVLFAINHLGFTTYYGDFTGVSGNLVLDPAKPAASSVSVTIPVASISTTNAKLNEELVGAKWLDAAQFPTIAFKSTQVSVTGPNTADVTGDLTLHGVTKPVVLAVKFNASGPHPMNHKTHIGFDAIAHIKRSDFGVSAYVPMVGDPVDIIISADFEKTN